MGKFLNKKQITILKEAHHAALGRKAADRIKTMLLLDDGLPYDQVAKILLLDDSTIRRYEQEFQKTGIDGLLEDRYQGSTGFLTGQQEEELTIYLRQHTYQTVKAIVGYVKKHYQVNYSIEGMTHVLHRLHFVYKKTKVVPGKLNQEKQEAFKQAYAQLKATKKPEDKIYFVDASHPVHNNEQFYGWIYKGEDKLMKGNSGRERLNLNGAINLEDMRIIVGAEPTINTQAMMNLVLVLERQQPEGEIIMIVDNASYNHSKKLCSFLTAHPRVRLIFLPAYSPNLNIIERLWLFFQRKQLYDHYYETFDEFRSACMNFFGDLRQYEDELKTLLTDSFQKFTVIPT